ncbi:unnamed protein product [Rodentolepis nana]|uniref:Uncharacterized protein n=1 Tax=Rodentolepis nana TaxID=102285 RepID=A0A158QGW7_RODNA|nr:unnamed protein product [Rodentolepis nana]
MVIKPENQTSSTSKGGVAALMDCAATEMSRLRNKSTVLKRYAIQETRRSPEPPPSPPHPQTPHKINAQERKEKATSTTDTLTSLLQIQLAQINRMSETFSNQIAHERALLELLQLEYNRVKSEVKICESENDSAPADLMNQFRHLKERLEQQETLIDDLEYQYLEDKTKYEEEKESLIAQLKQQEETNSETSHKTGHLGNGGTGARREQSPEDAYTYPSSIFSSNVPHTRAISPICSPPTAVSPLKFNGNQSNSNSIDNHREIFQSGNTITSNDKNDVAVPREEVPQSMPLSSPRSVISSNGDFSHFSHIMMSSSPVGHLQNTPVLQEQKTPSQLNSSPSYHQQNGSSMDETCYTRREDQNASPQTSSSFQGGGSNPHTTTTSSSSSLFPSGRDLQQSSCTSFSNNVFHAVPPLLSSLSANADNRQWSREDPVPNRCNEEVRIRQRQRTSSAVSRQYWQDNEVITQFY